MRFSTRAARGCHCCPSSSPPITVCRDSGRRIPGLICVISYMLGTITGGIATGSWMRRRGGSLIRSTSPDTTRKQWITPIRAAPTEPPRDIYVPMSQSVPVAASSPAHVATPPAPAPAETLPPPPTPTSNSPAPIPPRVSRELEYEGYVEMPGRT